MFPFGDDPLEPSFKKPPFQLYDQIQNPIISKQDESPFFSNFPSPFFDEHELLPLNQIFPNLQSKPAIPPTLLASSDQPQKISDATKKDPPKPKQKDGIGGPPRRRSLGAVAAAPRKRTGKKDRHSKICTAQGIRDRRMRLSLQVARKFFDLQDMLGYDKASKTIEWLFSKSKKAIKELTKDIGVRVRVRANSVSDGCKSESFVSECEVVSGIEENCSNNNEGLPLLEKKIQNTRESRDKARARARCRTEEKMMGKRLESSPNRNLVQILGSSSSTPFHAAADVQERVSPYVHPPSDAGTIEKLLGNSTSDHYNCSAAVSSCIDPTTAFMGFLGNWDLLSNDRLNYAGNPNSIYSPTTPDFPLFHQ